MGAIRQRLLGLVGLEDPGHPWILRSQRLRRRLFRSDAHVSGHYLALTADPKLHIGGGAHLLDGWLNTDLAVIPGVTIMDATRRFPFADGSFQFVFSEHMIEHIQYEDAIGMLRECHRVMRKGGIIRVTTPDLAAITGLYAGKLSGSESRYLSWFCETFLPPDHPRTAASAINAHFRMWGHQFLYDEWTLAEALRMADFKSVTRRRLGESPYAALQRLENVDRYPEGLLDFESVALEASK